VITRDGATWKCRNEPFLVSGQYHGARAAGSLYAGLWELPADRWCLLAANLDNDPAAAAVHGKTLFPVASANLDLTLNQGETCVWFASPAGAGDATLRWERGSLNADARTGVALKPISAVRARTTREVFIILIIGILPIPRLA